MLKIKQLSYVFIFLSQIINAQNLDWDRNFGGSADEFLFDAIPTADYGILLAGGSLSGASKSKATSNFGKLDYWLWKIDEGGELKWERNFGGSENDICTVVIGTSDGGFLVGGNSASMPSESKKAEYYGDFDFWILKLNAFGAVEWEKSFGGAGSEELVSIVETKDKGFLILGNSSSGKSGNKTTPSFGGVDLYLIKVDKKGEELWQKSYGGNYNETAVKVLIWGADFLVGYNSNSTDSSTDIEPLNDAKLLLINGNGDLIQQQELGGTGADDLVDFALNGQDRVYCVLNSNSNVSGNKSLAAKDGTDIWMVELDTEFTVLKQHQFNYSQNDLAQGLELLEDRILISAKTDSRMEHGRLNSSFKVIQVDYSGSVTDEFSVAADGENTIRKSLLARDNSLFLLGTGETKNTKGPRAFQRDFRVAKLKFKKSDKKQREKLEVIPNPVHNYTNFIVGFSFNTGKLLIHDIAGKLVHTQEINDRTIPFDASLLQPGIYVATVSTNSGQAVTKFIKASN
ncbi:T9SS type A sorting domain-containing protein [Flavobacterium sp.]|uniref:T9SS type A sorting domain-containing protein n=1 Tax=Flavobacterium sp. TaxID=239 RepID=UPI00263A394A|nr:T9SS type A sorting domain-containing protein [Flavobacterium sp.]